MKHFLILFIIIFSCKNEYKENKAILDVRDTLNYTYVWVNQNYLDALTRNKSHAKAQQGIEISFLGVNPYSNNPEEGLSPTNEDIMIIWKFQVGVGYDLTKSQDSYVLDLDADELSSEYPKRIDIKMISGSKLYMANDTFVKTTCHDLNIIHNNLIITGDYQNNNSLVSFDSIGFINGLGNYNHYTLSMNPNQDIIRLNVEDWFLYKFKNDTLILYKCNCLEIDTPRSIDCIKCDTSEILYRLKKI